MVCDVHDIFKNHAYLLLLGTLHLSGICAAGNERGQSKCRGRKTIRKTKKLHTYHILFHCNCHCSLTNVASRGISNDAQKASKENKRKGGHRPHCYAAIVLFSTNCLTSRLYTSNLSKKSSKTSFDGD